MHNKLTLSLLILASLSFSNCKKTKPVACATSDKKTILAGESINFTSCSNGAVALKWDFGDGQTGEGENVNHKFDSAGVYVVQLKAESKKAKFIDKYSLAVTVNNPPPPPAPKERYLTQLSLTQFPAQDNGSDWDGFPSTGNATNPDIIVKMELWPPQGWMWQSGEFSNATPSMLPRIYNLSPSEIKLTNQTWRFSILDNDQVSGMGGVDTMFTTIINPSTIPANGGKFSVGNLSAGYNLDVYFLEK